ncbi:MAG: OmpH family outer membrane protein [Syntrophales bacterium]|nr:OmpH family outer membrane protein [Syntrophales bacterium]
MKRYGLAISGILMVLVSVLVLPGFHAMAGEKIGFVDIREVMLNSDAGKKAAEEFKKLLEKDRILIQERETELKKLKDEVEKQSSILTETARKEKEAAYQKKFRDYQLLVKDINEDLQAKDRELANKMVPEILKLLAAIGEKEKYTLILDIGTIQVPYFAKENDITKQVIEEFNKTHKPQK